MRGQVCLRLLVKYFHLSRLVGQLQYCASSGTAQSKPRHCVLHNGRRKATHLDWLPGLPKPKIASARAPAFTTCARKTTAGKHTPCWCDYHCLVPWCPNDACRQAWACLRGQVAANTSQPARKRISFVAVFDAWQTTLVCPPIHFNRTESTRYQYQLFKMVVVVNAQ